MSLDSIQKKNDQEPVKPTTYEQIGSEKKGTESRKKRLVDNFRIIRSHKVKVYPAKSRTNQKIKIYKPNLLLKQKRLFQILLIIIFCIATLSVILLQSRIFKLFRLAYDIKNESIILGFQNSSELRPSGGFWGSFAILNVKENLSQSEILFETNPYKNDNPLLKTSTTELPKPMKESWSDRPQSFVNANWALDFGEAGKTLEYYFGQGWNQSTDGVVGISSLALIDLLRLTGPITTNDGTQISADNFTEVMSQKIDTEYWQSEENKITNEPKTIVKDIAPEIIARVKKLPKLRIYEFVLGQMEKGRIIAYFNDNKKQNIAEDLGFSGRLLPYNKDYLSINNANLNGGKSSLNINQTIKYSISKDNDKPIAHVEVTRTYPDHSWPDILNRNYTRVVAPLGSKFISAKLDGIDASSEVETLDESGRTTFGFWFSVGPTESKTVILEYELPFSLNSSRNYGLVLQKQPGTLADQIDISAFGKNLFSGLFDQNFAKF